MNASENAWQDVDVLASVISRLADDPDQARRPLVWQLMDARAQAAGDPPRNQGPWEPSVASCSEVGEGGRSWDERDPVALEPAGRLAWIHARLVGGSFDHPDHPDAGEGGGVVVDTDPSGVVLVDELLAECCEAADWASARHHEAAWAWKLTGSWAGAIDEVSSPADSVVEINGKMVRASVEVVRAARDLVRKQAAATTSHMWALRLLGMVAATIAAVQAWQPEPLVRPQTPGRSRRDLVVDVLTALDSPVPSSWAAGLVEAVYGIDLNVDAFGWLLRDETDEPGQLHRPAPGWVGLRTGDSFYDDIRADTSRRLHLHRAAGRLLQLSLLPGVRIADPPRLDELTMSALADIGTDVEGILASLERAFDQLALPVSLLPDTFTSRKVLAAVYLHRQASEAERSYDPAVGWMSRPPARRRSPQRLMSFLDGTPEAAWARLEPALQDVSWSWELPYA